MEGKRRGLIKHSIFFLLAVVLTASMGPSAFAGDESISSFPLNVSVEGARVTLSWDAVENAESYYLLYVPRPNPTNQNFSSYPTGNQTTLSFDLFDNASYDAAVMAVNGAGVVGYSGVESVVVRVESLVSASLTAFESEEALAAYLKKGMSENAGRFNYWRPDPLFFSPFVAADAGEGGGDASSSVSFSTTNLQEVGVDEADIIKTDGRYLYIAPNEYGGVYSALGTPFSQFGGEATPGDSSAEIGVFEISDNPPASTKVGAIPLSDHQNSVEGLYLLTDRGEDKPDLLVTIGGQAQNYRGYWCDPWFWMSGVTEVGLYNAADPLHVEAVVLITLDGQLISSRRIGDVLYVVTRYTPGLEGFDPHPAEGGEEANNAALEGADLSDLLPAYSLDGQSQGSMVRAQGCYLPPHEENVIPEPSLITVTAIPLSDPGNPISQTITGPTETIYASADTLYLATTRYEYTAPTADPDLPGASTSVGADIWTPPPETTDLHKFNLTENGPVYRGSGSAPGNLGWEEDKKPFRMSHYNG
ncbi:MAG: hypothetical protein GY859_19365, partial [Desulfobacterales bacterium]|nr:hypothetical protein [Desulfobacterales bacterium]